MRKKQIKIGMVLLLLTLFFGSTANTRAFPFFLGPAQKYGAKDCTFCHLQKTGGQGFNSRGKWLIAEKSRRGAQTVNVEWLKDYRSGRK